MGLKAATRRSIISGRQSGKQGKDGASWSGNEMKEARKVRIPQKQKSKICQLLPFSHYYYQYHPSVIKETASHHTDKSCSWIVKIGKRKNSIQIYGKQKANKNISADLTESNI